MSREVCRSSRSTTDQTYTPPDAWAAELAADRDGVLSIDQLRTCGLDRDAVAVRVRNGWLHRLHRGVYAVGHAGVSLRGRFRAAVLACGAGTALGWFAAAADWELIAWKEREIEVIVTSGGARRIEGVRVHRSRSLTRRDVRFRNGIPVTSPARTLLDLATVLSEHALRRAARQAQALKLVTVAELIEIAERCNGHRGAVKLRAVVADGPAPTRSRLEDLLVDLLDAAGIPRPEINVALRPGGRTIIPDVLWRDRRLAIEADSVTWHDHKLTRENDADKQAILEAHGFRVVRVTHEQLSRRPAQTLERIRAALDAGLPGPERRVGGHVLGERP
jgi:predicted transcriptional regulator of viral defense system